MSNELICLFREGVTSWVVELFENNKWHPITFTQTRQLARIYLKDWKERTKLKGHYRIVKYEVVRRSF